MHLAQLNVGTPLAPLDGPTMAGFAGLLAELNALADAAPGFVWRLQAEGEPDATSLRLFGTDEMVNMSVWESLEDLRAYTYHSAHLDALRQRRAWFAPPAQEHLVLWWVPAGTLPTLAEAGERLARLRGDGPTPHAFTLRNPFPAPGGAEAGALSG